MLPGVRRERRNAVYPGGRAVVACLDGEYSMRRDIPHSVKGDPVRDAFPSLMRRDLGRARPYPGPARDHAPQAMTSKAKSAGPPA